LEIAMNRLTLFVALLSFSSAAQAGSYSAGTWGSATKDEGLWEVLVETVNDYSGTGMNMVYNCNTSGAQVVSYLGLTGFNNYRRYTDANAWSSDFEEALTDDLYQDAGDLNFYCGHGGSGAFTFNGSSGDDLLEYSETSWGEMDAEVMAIQSCQVLDSAGRANFISKNRTRGIHYILGFESNALDTSVLGERYGYYLAIGYTVRDAWIYGSQESHGSGTGAYVRFSNSACNTIGDVATSLSCDPNSRDATSVSYTWTL
jgi:hypothetical protein